MYFKTFPCNHSSFLSVPRKPIAEHQRRQLCAPLISLLWCQYQSLVNLLKFRKDSLVALERFDGFIFGVRVKVGGVERVLNLGHVSKRWFAQQQSIREMSVSGLNQTANKSTRERAA